MSVRNHVKGRFEVRVVVHHVYDLKAHGKEIFPDAFVEARIKGRGPKMETDVHEDDERHSPLQLAPCPRAL